MFDMAGTSKKPRGNTRAKLTPEMEAKKWKPGQSGNPNGRPKKQLEVAEKAEEHAVKAIEKLAKLMNSQDERVALAATQEILDRAVGKSKQTTENVNHNKNTNEAEPVSETAAFIADAVGTKPDRKDKESVH